MCPFILSTEFGGLVGLSLGLTGGDGAILAVPLVVQGLGVPPHEGVGGPVLQNTFAVAIGAVAVLVIVRILKLETRQTPGAHAAG